MVFSFLLRLWSSFPCLGKVQDFFFNNCLQLVLLLLCTLYSFLRHEDPLFCFAFVSCRLRGSFSYLGPCTFSGCLCVLPLARFFLGLPLCCSAFFFAPSVPRFLAPQLCRFVAARNLRARHFVHSFGSRVENCGATKEGMHEDLRPSTCSSLLSSPLLQANPM
jgi:hypothetical protein